MTYIKSYQDASKNYKSVLKYELGRFIQLILSKIGIARKTLAKFHPNQTRILGSITLGKARVLCDTYLKALLRSILNFCI